MPIRTTIEISGAKQNNLKNISLEIPRDKFIVFTGVSGSGKSSLAFDIIYGEAQRRFLDSISNFAKNRISQVKKPKVDFVRGLSPVIAIEQKKGNSNPRSTVGTVTDINDYLRLLFSTIGVGKCPICGYELHQKSVSFLAEHISSLKSGTEVELRAPVERIFGESYEFLFNKIREKGFKNLLIDGKPHSLSDKFEIDEENEYKIEIIIDRFSIKSDIYIQIAKSIEAALIALNDDIFIKIEIIGGISPQFYDKIGCPKHHYTLCEMQPYHFSFNVAASACNTCLGVGKSFVAEPRFLVVDESKSIMKGALKSTLFNTSGKDSYQAALIYSLSVKYNFSLDTPFNELSKEVHELLFYGTKGEKLKMLQPPFSKKRNWIIDREYAFRGFVHNIEYWYRQFIRKSISSEVGEPGFIKDTMIEKICPDCKGARLKKTRLDVMIAEKNIDDLCRMQFQELIDFLESLQFSNDTKEVGISIVGEIKKRLQLLVDIGLHYLSLGRQSDSISGGEMQRIKMSTQISSELMGMLYVMDEPSIGLHPRDTDKVINIMKKLRDIGNTVIVVEHDIETIKNADFLIEIGPGPGIHGGSIVAKGSYDDFIAQQSITGDFLLGKKQIKVPQTRRSITNHALIIKGARENNLKNIDVAIPLNLFVAITGVSGSGKSTLINEILFKKLEIIKKSSRIIAGEHDEIIGADIINQVINLDQTAIGRSSKSNPATYIGIYDKIRDLFAFTPEALARGYQPIDFSLTHSNGTRCENCTGDGILTTSLQFMADIETICPVCKGERFSKEGLEIKYKDKNIFQVLDMCIEEALEFFKDNKYLKHKLTILNELGLGYVKLGQNSTTLSGGEAQRIKLAYELAKIKHGSHNLYILDEPTTGLHLSDIQKLLDCLNKLVDNGHSVLVIEHNLDVIKSADYIIDLGPEGGKNGGYIVAKGTPEEISKIKKSFTGNFLKTVL